LKNPPTPTPS